MNKLVWDGVMRALGAHPQSIRSIRGVSGYSHSLVAVGVDDVRKRLLIISAETDPRMVAMAHADIQAADTSVHVVAARAVPWDFSAMLSTDVNDASMTSDAVSSTVSMQETLKRVLPLVVTDDPDDVLRITGGMFHAMTRQLFATSQTDDSAVGDISERTAAIALQESERTTDVLSFDRQLGICPIPLFELTDVEIETMITGEGDAIAQALRRVGVWQYFFPAADQLALGLLERGTARGETLGSVLGQAPQIGHPYGAMELVPPKTPLAELVEALVAQKLVVEGEVSCELTPQGESVRSTVRFKPRESIVTKLINRLSVSLNLKDLFGGGGS